MATRFFGIRAGVGALAAGCLAGCAGLPDWSLFGPPDGQGQSIHVAASYDFSWRLSGDRRAGPIQVFDDGTSTWLQFAPNQPVPVIFARTEQGDRLLAHRASGPYVMLDGVWPLLILRAAGLESRAQRVTVENGGQHSTQHTAADQGGADADGAVSGASGLDADTSVAGIASTLAAHPPVSATAPFLSDEPLQPPEAPKDEPPPSTLAASESWQEEGITFPLGAAPAHSYRVSPDDVNMRLVLSRWAKSAGWTFEPEHWAVDVDIPIAGTAEFELEFDEAVQQLIASTELSERPLQPCFYANKVLRVVSYAQSCDRSAPLERA